MQRVGSGGFNVLSCWWLTLVEENSLRGLSTTGGVVFGTQGVKLVFRRDCGCVSTWECPVRELGAQKISIS